MNVEDKIKILLERVSKRRKNKWELTLFACAIKDAYTRRDLEYYLKEYFPSDSAIGTTHDGLLPGDYNKIYNGMVDYVFPEGQRKEPFVYSITKKGEDLLYERFPTEIKELNSIMNRGRIKEDVNIVAIPKATAGIVDELIEQMKDSCVVGMTFLDGIQVAIIDKCIDTMNMLLKKNESYGNSSLEPVGVFNGLCREAKIEARMEDKLARIRNLTRSIKNAEKDCNEDMIPHYKDALLDAVKDLRGYLVLYEIALEEEK